MSQPSTWPLTKEAIRILIPHSYTAKSEASALTESCFPTAVGYYPKAFLHHMERVSHDDYILIYCADGVGVVELEGKRYIIQRGDAFILPPNKPHAYYSDTQQPWTIFWCHFKGKDAGQWFENIYSQTKSLIFSVSEISIRPIFEDLLDVASAMHYEKCTVHLCSVISYLLTKIVRSTRLAAKGKLNSIAEVQYFLRSNIAKKVTLDELASLSGLSKYYFVNQYKELTGYSPLKHFQIIKMEHASFLLEQSKMNVSEIADATGYDDSLYFSRCFKKHFGVSPSIYRKSLNADR